LADEFEREFQDLITRTGKHLDTPTIECSGAANAGACNHWPHSSDGKILRGPALEIARRIGAVRPQADLLQTAVYAGVPAANTAFHIAQKELEATGLQPSNEAKK
jgi:hypothetical protein